MHPGDISPGSACLYTPGKIYAIDELRQTPQEIKPQTGKGLNVQAATW